MVNKDEYKLLKLALFSHLI